MKEHKYRLFFLPVLLALLILNGCARSPLPVESYGAAGTEQTAPGGEMPSPESAGGGANTEDSDTGGTKPAEDARTAQARFDEFTDRCFSRLLTKDPMLTHFVLQNPEGHCRFVQKNSRAGFSYKKWRRRSGCYGYRDI